MGAPRKAILWKSRKHTLRVNSRGRVTTWLLNLRSDSSGLGGLVPGGISRSRERPNLSAMVETERSCETNPRQIDSRPCNLDPRECQESVDRTGSCARSSRINPVVMFLC